MNKMWGRRRISRWNGLCLTRLIVGLVCIFGVLAPYQVLAGSQPIAKDARLGGDLKRTRFVADLSKAVNFRVFTLADPYRVIVDLPEVKFSLPDKLGRKGRGLVRAYRYGLYSAGKSRIVIDVKRPVLVEKAFVTKPQNGQPARFVIDLVPTDRATYLANLAIHIKETRFPTKSMRRAALTNPYAHIIGHRGQNKKPLIVLDPGHGGIDSGAVSQSGKEEKNLVFEFAKVLKNRLLATKKYRILMTRHEDVYVPLRDRVEFARQNGASLMISLHADSLPKRKKRRWAKVRGATVYTLSEKASDEEAEALANKENRADIIAGVELPPETNFVTKILINLAQRETKNYSLTLADTLIQDMREATELNLQPHRYADLRVLKAPDIPSVLVELGYVTNKSDVKALSSKEWRVKVSDAMANAINKYFKRRLAAGR